MLLGKLSQAAREGIPNKVVSARRPPILKIGARAGTVLAFAMAAPIFVIPTGNASALTPSVVAANSARAASVGTRTVSFSGHYHGVASLLINNGVVTISSVAGVGTATLLGASTVAGKGTASSTAQCDPFTGKGSLSGAHGKINLTVTDSKSQGCSSGQSGPVKVTFQGVAVAEGGTGTASGATGSLDFKGTLNLTNTSGSQNGPYTVTLTGSLTVKG